MAGSRWLPATGGRLAEEHRSAVLIELRDTEEGVERHEVTLLVAIVRDDDAERQVVRHRETSDGARTRTRELQRTADEADRVAGEPERHVRVARSDEDVVVVGERDSERPVEEHRGRGDLDDGVGLRGLALEDHRLTDVRRLGEPVEGNLLRPARRVAGAVVDLTLTAERDGSGVRDRRVERRRERDARRVAERLAVRRHAVPLRVTSDAEDRTVLHRTGARADRHHRIALDVPRGVVDDESGEEVVILRAERRHVLAHVGVEAEDAAEARLAERRASVAALVGLAEHRVREDLRLHRRGHDEVATAHRSLRRVEPLAELEDVVLRVRRGHAVVRTGLARRREKPAVLTEDDAIDLLRERRHGRDEVERDERLHALRLLTILDHERHVQVLIERDRDVGELRILHRHRVRIDLALRAEGLRPTGVDDITRLRELVLEVAVDERAGDHLALQDGEAELRPQLRDERIVVVGEDACEHLGLVVHGCPLFCVASPDSTSHARADCSGPSATAW